MTFQVIKHILNDTVEERHWRIIASAISCQFSREDSDLTLGALMKILEDGKIKWKEENKNDEPERNLLSKTN